MLIFTLNKNDLLNIIQEYNITQNILGKRKGIMLRIERKTLLFNKYHVFYFLNKHTLTKH
jgi:hypothetical protein